MKITQTAQIRSGNIDWKSFGFRIEQFRTYKKLTKEEVGDALDIGEASITALEKGWGRERKSTNIIWKASQVWNLSLNWLLNGAGSFHSPDPVGLLPETLIIQRGAGIRRATLRAEAEEGTYTDEMFEFVMAIDKFKNSNKIPFPSWTQIFEIITALGYRKSVPARIAPLGYLLSKQKLAEELKQVHESMEVWSSTEDADNEIDFDLMRNNWYKKHKRQKRKTLTERNIWIRNTTKPCFICGVDIHPGPKDNQETWEDRKVCGEMCRRKIISIWNDDEVRILRENYSEQGSQVKTLLPGKTIGQIQNKVIREKLKVKKELRWRGQPGLLTPEQESIVREKYPTMGTKVCALPEMKGIDPKQIHSWCYRNKLRCDPKIKCKPRNPEEAYKLCIQCGNLIWPKEKDGSARWSQRKLCGEECRKKHASTNLTGKSIINWTDKMDRTIRTEYQTKSREILARELGVSISLLYKRAKALEVAKNRNTRVYLERPGDDKILREWYPLLGALGVKERFFSDRPGVTQVRIQHRTEKLNIKRQKDRFHFSPEDEEIIRQNYPAMGLDCQLLLAHNPNATRYRVGQRAAQLGVQRIKTNG